ncbi:MAG: hypothetical protein AB1499_09840, partial [Nitrospirota bacterium]
MKHGTLFIAPVGARNRRASLFKEITAAHPGNDFSGVLFLGPNNFSLSEAERQFFSHMKKQHGASAYIPFRSLTIRQAASMLHESSSAEGQEGGDEISEHIRPLILCEILKNTNIGYARILSELYRKTRHYVFNKPLSRIKEDIRELIFEEKARERAVRAVEILEAYEADLETRNVVDPVDALRDFTVGAYCNTPLHPITSYGFTTLVIDGFFDPTPLEMEIIKILMDRADKAFVLAEEDSGTLSSIRSKYPGMETRHMKRDLMREKPGCYTYPSIEDEVEGIARHIKKLLLEGMKPWEITVSFAALPKYLPMVRRIFKKYGVPGNVSQYDLSAAGPVTALNELLSCISEDYPRNAFLSVLTSPYFPMIPGVLKERAVSYSYMAGIIKGKES